MKKLLILSVFAGLAFTGCKKKASSVSTLYNHSVPTIILPDNHYYSIPVGGVLPTIEATAYDSFYHEDCAVVYDQSKLDNTVADAYKVYATAKNKYGMMASELLYVAVTDIDTLVDLSGLYARMGNDDTVMITKLANGFYMTNDVGANGTMDTTNITSAYFVQTSDIALSMPEQDTKFGVLSGTSGFINMTPGDTTIEYVINNSTFDQSVRLFKKL